MGEVKKQESFEEGKKILHTYPLVRVSYYIVFFFCDKKNFCLVLLIAELYHCQKKNMHAKIQVRSRGRLNDDCKDYVERCIHF